MEHVDAKLGAVRAHIWDAGKMERPIMRKTHYKNARGALVVYDAEHLVAKALKTLPDSALA